ncbi:uncharacterized protein PITG_15334 [Phytophthora infestans T30-4]|uniref:Uncharacterized protein n=1 Tax=Phytophthora infestans (strain T30-4) TaxID=403677 RepID=D0NQG5_PHYIT|nr:uncharacterized protein PITG_15334 [Phytophthora infestans T30-4]EEY62897.1 hypothetical protein PITG_15334 [Phytophthora infestans T30-4]|eukprot:XP_002898772.1 hypothetical protein PITG_15334 [Phytophthora infestans T30-4]
MSKDLRAINTLYPKCTDSFGSSLSIFSARKKRKEIAFYRLLGSPMTSALQLGELAFVGPTHSAQLNDFQYVEITDLTDSVATVKIVGPDDDKNNDTFDIPIDIV